MVELVCLSQGVYDMAVEERDRFGCLAHLM
jgi:hypothetical protein